MKFFAKIAVYLCHYSLDPFFLVAEVAKIDDKFLSEEASKLKNHYRSRELETRVSSSPEVGHLLVCQFFKNEDLESTDSVRL